MDTTLLHTLKNTLTHAATTEEAMKSISKIIGMALPTMKLEDIKANTLSTHATHSACVYEAITDTVMIADPDYNPDTQNSKLISIPKGSRMIISGCGDQSYLGVSYYLYGDQWGHIPNSHMKHVANPILEVAPGNYPIMKL